MGSDQADVETAGQWRVSSIRGQLQSTACRGAGEHYDGHDYMDESATPWRCCAHAARAKRVVHIKSDMVIDTIIELMVSLRHRWKRGASSTTKALLPTGQLWKWSYGSCLHYR